MCAIFLCSFLYSAANDPRPQMIPRPEMIPKLDRKSSRTANDPRCEPQMIPPENNEWHGFWFLGFFLKLVMFIFCLFDVGYWIRVNTVQKVKRKNMLPKYVGSFSAEVRTVYFFQVSSPFKGILRRNSEAITAHLIAFGVPRYTNILKIRSGVALHTNICPEIFLHHLKRYLSAF